MRLVDRLDPRAPPPTPPECNREVRPLSLVAAATLAGVCPWLVAAAPISTCIELVGEWESSLGQSLEIVSADPESGALSGIYRSPFGEAGRFYPLVGWVNGPEPGEKANEILGVIAFTVRFEGHGSVVAWSGTCALMQGVPTISTLWHSARTGGGAWEHVLTNYEVWTPVTSRVSIADGSR